MKTSLAPRLPQSSRTLFEAKKQKNLTFEAIAHELGRDEVAVAAIFYGQAMASAEDINKLALILDVPVKQLETELQGFPDRGRLMDMPPKDPTVYRLYEIVQNYGYAYKAVLHEKFGDGIMSAISFSTKVEKETDEKGDWAKITLRGKWYVFCRPALFMLTIPGCHIRDSKHVCGEKLVVYPNIFKQAGTHEANPTVVATLLHNPHSNSFLER